MLAIIKVNCHEENREKPLWLFPFNDWFLYWGAYVGWLAQKFRIILTVHSLWFDPRSNMYLMIELMGDWSHSVLWQPWFYRATPMTPSHPYLNTGWVIHPRVGKGPDGASTRPMIKVRYLQSQAGARNYPDADQRSCPRSSLHQYSPLNGCKLGLNALVNVGIAPQ